MNNILQSKVDLYKEQSVRNKDKVVTSARKVVTLIECFSIPSELKQYCRSVIISDPKTLELNNELNPNIRTAIQFAGRYFRVRFMNKVKQCDNKIISIRVFKVDKKTFNSLNAFHQSIAVKEGSFYVFYLACVAPKKEE